ncbi:MAG: MarC family protein [Bacteroidales bacterium]
MHDHFTQLLLVFTSFFSLINPLGAMPVFMTMTSRLNEREKKRTALRACITAFATLMVFAFTGQLLFKVFGISVNGFRIVGGVIFFLMGYDMLNARISRIKISKKDVKEYVDDISITPLGIPILAGPGSITNSIVLMEDAHGLTARLILIVAILLVLIIAYFSLVGSGQFLRLVGETGNKVLTKLMGLIVMVIAVEFFVSGIKPIVRDILMIG